jgi:transposase
VVGFNQKLVKLADNPATRGDIGRPDPAGEFLPPYSPELNPQENVWQFLRQNQLANRVYDNYEDIVDACCKAWNGLMALPEQIRSIGNRDYAAVNL